MDTLHSVLRSIRGETPPRTRHLAVFREFLAHLDRIGRRTMPRPPQAAPRVKGRRGGKR